MLPKDFCLHTRLSGDANASMVISVTLKNSADARSVAKLLNETIAPLIDKLQEPEFKAPDAEAVNQKSLAERAYEVLGDPVEGVRIPTTSAAEGASPERVSPSSYSVRQGEK